MELKQLHYYSFLFYFFITLNNNAQISFVVQDSLLPNAPEGIEFPIGVFDMNGDLLDDLTFFDSDYNLHIYLSNKSGVFTSLRFEEVTTTEPWAICGGDVDNDGINEIIFGGEQYLTVFDVSRARVKQQLPTDLVFLLQGATLFDINRDGSLDFFACNDYGTNHLYQNSQSGKLVREQGLMAVNDDPGNYAAVWSDVDGDLDADLYISKCLFGASFGDPVIVNLLYINHNGTFMESAAAAGIDDPAQSWAADFADIDNDGDMDLFVINHEMPCNLFLNDGQGNFTNITEQANLVLPTSTTYLQVLFRDFDNDGWIDLLVGGGVEFGANGELRTYLYQNNGNLTFSLVEHPLGNEQALILSSFAAGDLNADGLIDLYGLTVQEDRGAGQLFSNTSSSDFNFIQINLQGTESNRMGVGAILKLYGAWGVQVRELRSGESYGISNSLTKTFGLANFEQFDSLIIHWPSGIRQKVSDLTLNALNQIVESKEATTVHSALPSKHKLYPNVTTGIVSVESLDQQTTQQHVQILNIEGKLVYQMVLNGPKQQLMDISHLPKGVYLYHITNDNKLVGSGKLIKIE